MIKMSIVESLQFDLDTIKSTTSNFSHDNKLGEGGLERYTMYVNQL